MRFRVAIPAALLVLILLILLTVCCGSNMAESRNAGMASELEGICRAVGAATEGEDVSARIETVSAYSLPARSFLRTVRCGEHNVKQYHRGTLMRTNHQRIFTRGGSYNTIAGCLEVER